ncbi:MAG: ADP-glyceromanno-heptose 6-epimerase [Bacteroidia bacterium]|nr:ADP-glyceromanno-heptose 6-epimerase [Bacteroidia bacterium]MCC6768747.1 ADP-glyceromanno-heptose 6-epimerase [Bacteroidia bacterium]
MIVITGAAGFIGSCLASYLNEQGYFDLVLVDDFSIEAKKKNWEQKRYSQLVQRELLGEWLDNNHALVQFIFHLGARTDTTEFRTEIFDKLNLEYSKMVWQKCVVYGLPLVYASSAATYGMGEHGYNDDHQVSALLHPLNPYGLSKLQFDNWALAQQAQPYCWAGLKFFNVYGPNEYHKGRMASVIFHAYRQMKEGGGTVRLFRSHHPDYTDGGQMRDFVYVKDVAKVCYFLMLHRKFKGLYNLGSGKARTFNDLAASVFNAAGISPSIQYIDTPEDIRDKYQYFTEAAMAKLHSIGYSEPFYSLEEGTKDYLLNYLIQGKNY